MQYMQYAISGAQAYSLILRLLFNAKIDREKLNPIEIDLYIQLDLILSVVGGASHFFIVMLGPDFIKNDQNKNMIDYMLSGSIIIALIRFFSLFLVNENISKMLLTLYVMVLDVWPFAIIMCCYYVIGMQVFSTIY